MPTAGANAMTIFGMPIVEVADTTRSMLECAVPDCEVLLHTSSTLSRIVAREKRPYLTANEREELRHD